MATGKYQEWLEPDGLLRLAAWARDGLTDEQLMAKMRISSTTLYAWKREHPQIAEALKRGKEVVDIEVENALLKKAQGYTVMLAKTFKVRRVEFDPETGRKTAEYEKLVRGFDEVHIPADTTAQIFWLKNRKAEAWRDKPAEADDSGVQVTILAPRPSSTP